MSFRTLQTHSAIAGHRIRVGVIRTIQGIHALQRGPNKAPPHRSISSTRASSISSSHPFAAPPTSVASNWLIGEREQERPIRATGSYSKNFHIHVSKSRREAKDLCLRFSQPSWSADSVLSVWSDGSHSSREGVAATAAFAMQAGYGPGARRGVLVHQRQLRLVGTRKLSILHAEITGAILALDIAIASTQHRPRFTSIVPKEVRIFVDSMAAIEAIALTSSDSLFRSRRSILDNDYSVKSLCKEFHLRRGNLLEGRKDLDLVLVWVPAHEQIPGNERADTLAKQARRKEQGVLFGSTTWIPSQLK